MRPGGKGPACFRLAFRSLPPMRALAIYSAPSQIVTMVSIWEGVKLHVLIVSAGHAGYSVTVTVPIMLGWMVQWYWYVPGVS